MSEHRELPKPVDFDQLYPGRFLKSGDLLGQKVTVTIENVALDELEGDRGKRIQGIIYLRGKDKQIVLNRTNGECLKAMFGRKLSEWLGKRITIYQSKTKFGPETVDCIRIWGSPDIQADLQFTLRLPKKKPVPMTMHRVVPRARPEAPPVEDPPPPEESQQSDEGATL